MLLFAFAVTVTGLMLVPGPNVALIIANSVSHGSRYGLLTVAGTSSAMVLQLGLTALGMTEMLGTLGAWFEWLRWVGVAYLITIGVAQWRERPVDLTETQPQPKSAKAIYVRAFLVSLTNPKTLIFYGAFFPQFVVVTEGVEGQIAILSLIFLGIAILVDGAWALIAGRARGVLAPRGRLRNRISGGMLIGAGAGLALARVK